MSAAVRLLAVLWALWALPATAQDGRFGRNGLAGAVSPFLLQHADNPVHWQPWTPEVLDYARASGKPIFLSVGYSSCFWCHVMERESFEDDGVAAYLNENFVSILVDREERPDIDYLYQNALYAMTGGGGWPLNIFLDGEPAPFWGDTYFPDVDRHGMKSFQAILKLIKEAWVEDRDQIASITRRLRVGLASADDRPGEVTPKKLDRAPGKLMTQVDDFYGGFGDAPKYPHTQNLEVLWRGYLRTGKARYRDAVLTSLKRMVRGGLYDHLRGGFSRYAIDQEWRQPHFEKMLYTNALLVRLLTHAWQETGDEDFAAAVRETVDFVLDNMRTPDGAFGSTFDAETGAEEGRFYLWTAAEIDEALGPRAVLFRAAYEVTEEGTFEPEADWLATDYQREASVLFRTSTKTSELAALARIAENEVEPVLASARLALRRHREARRRPPPFDDKILADWNGLMIRALAEAGPALGEVSWLEAGRLAFNALVEVHEWRDEHDHARLRHASRGGKSAGPDLVEDYAQMSQAALALFKATGESQYLDRAESWTRSALAHHWDEPAGGFFQTADDEAQLIVRAKAALDGEVPAGSAAMADVLAQLYYLTGQQQYRDRADAALSVQGGSLADDYFAVPSVLIAADTLLGAVQVVIIGTRGDDDVSGLLNAVHRISLPNRVLQVIAPGDVLPAGHPAQYKTRVDGAATAYVCVGQICSLPATGAEDLRDTILTMRQSLSHRTTAPN